MRDKKIIFKQNIFFLLIFLFSLFYFNSFGEEFKIGNKATINSDFYKHISNKPEVFIIYKSSDLEIVKYWEKKTDGKVILFYNINNINWRKVSNLSFEDDFENKFKILKKDSYWVSFNSISKKNFGDSGIIKGEIVEINLNDNKLNFSSNKNVIFNGNAILAICLEPNYEEFQDEIYRHVTKYSYDDNHNKKVNKISYAPDFYFVTSEDSELKIERFQSLDIDNDMKMDFPYQKDELTGENGDTIFYKVKITNESSDSIFHLKIINPIADYTKMSYGDKSLEGTGYPIIKLENDEVIPIETFPLEGYGGNIETYFDELKSEETIYIYYCVKILR